MSDLLAGRIDTITSHAPRTGMVHGRIDVRQWRAVIAVLTTELLADAQSGVQESQETALLRAGLNALVAMRPVPVNQR